MNKSQPKKIYSAEIKGKGQEPKGIKVKMVKIPYTIDKKKQKETEKKALEKLNLMIKARQPKFDIEKYKAVQAIREKATGRDETKRDELLQKLLTPQEYEQYKKRKEEKEAEKQALHNAILQSRHLPMMLDELRLMKETQIQELAPLKSQLQQERQYRDIMTQEYKDIEEKFFKQEENIRKSTQLYNEGLLELEKLKIMKKEKAPTVKKIEGIPSTKEMKEIQKQQLKLDKFNEDIDDQQKKLLEKLQKQKEQITENERLLQENYKKLEAMKLEEIKQRKKEKSARKLARSMEETPLEMPEQEFSTTKVELPEKPEPAMAMGEEEAPPPGYTKTEIVKKSYLGNPDETRFVELYKTMNPSASGSVINDTVRQYREQIKGLKSLDKYKDTKEDKKLFKEEQKDLLTRYDVKLEGSKKLDTARKELKNKILQQYAEEAYRSQPKGSGLKFKKSKSKSKSKK